MTIEITKVRGEPTRKLGASVRELEMRIVPKKECVRYKKQHYHLCKMTRNISRSQTREVLHPFLPNYPIKSSSSSAPTNRIHSSGASLAFRRT